MVLCSIVKAELLFGARASGRVAENLRSLAKLFEHFPSLPFDDEAATRYGELRAELRREGTPIGPNDMLIAAIALVHSAAIVTRNVREFERVPELEVVRW
jgi:tRNA(fMet)-specific endonuclease VapC